MAVLQVYVDQDGLVRMLDLAAGSLRH
ncbi:hypothetical protein HaLaN_16139, partial [Haematococcus lacustris]